MNFALLTLPSPGGHTNIQSQRGRGLEGESEPHNEWNNLLLKVTKAEPLNNCKLFSPKVSCNLSINSLLNPKCMQGDSGLV